MTETLFALALCTALATAGCGAVLPPSYAANPQLLSLSPEVVYQGSSGPLSYHAAVGRDGQRLLPRVRVRGRACQKGLQIPILAILTYAGNDDPIAPSSLSFGWGEGGFQRALDDARSRLPEGAVLYDVMADLEVRSILNVYRQQCVNIDAGVLVPQRAAPAAR